MPGLIDIGTLIPFAAALLAALIGASVYAFRGAKRRAEQRIRDSYGRAPQPDRDELSYLKPYHEAFAEKYPSIRRIDDTTWNDLNMDDVFRRLNVCSCSVGEEYLYHLLHELKGSKAELEETNRLIQWADEHPEERLQIVRVLLGIGKRRNNGLSVYLFHAGMKRLPYAWLYALLAAMPVLGLALTPFFSTVGISVTLLAACANVIVCYLNRIKLEAELESMRYFSALLYGAKTLDKRSGKELAALGIDLKNSLKPFSKTRGLVPGHVQRGMAELEALTWIVKSVFLVDLILYNHTVGVMLRHISELNALYEAVGKLDAAVSAASFRRSLTHFCAPVFHEEAGIDCFGMYHPLLMNPVSNDARIGNDCIITGSNASGKSTFIKAIAVNCILAQTIGTCCAESFSLGFFYVATSMALRDDILAGDSYFVAEIKSLKRILEYCRVQRCAVFIDEVLRGTNTPERIAASSAVLRSLHETGSLCLVASHDVELTDILANAYDNYHFSERFEGNAILFDYLLKDGPSRSTNAIRLLEYMGFDRRIVDEAVALIQKNQHDI